MAAKPALSLLHLGHGLANGLSNLHNAKWARVPVINIVGDHARPLQQYHSHPGASHSSPYLGDIEGYAGPVSGWVRRVRTAEVAVADTLECLRASLGPAGQPKQVATLIVPADIAWAPAPAGQHHVYPSPSVPAAPNAAAVEGAAAVLGSGESCLLLIGGQNTSLILLSLFMLEMIILPRQARTNIGQKLPKTRRFVQAGMHCSCQGWSAQRKLRRAQAAAL